MIKSFKLPVTFDSVRLSRDLSRFKDSEWTPHFNTGYYEGDWSVIALRAATGSNLEIYPDPTATTFYDTGHLERCDYVREVIGWFDCPVETVRFMLLGPGDRILEHRDYCTGIENGTARVHIPIETNPEVEFVLDGEIVRMESGEAWYLNFNLPHRVTNRSALRRVHLVVDLIANDWFREIVSE